MSNFKVEEYQEEPEIRLIMMEAEKAAMDIVFEKRPGLVNDYSRLVKAGGQEFVDGIDGFKIKQHFNRMSFQEVREQVLAIANVNITFAIRVLQLENSARFRAFQEAQHGFYSG